jgi:GH24 family phage-related lysozyme (muramidase)
MSELLDAYYPKAAEFEGAVAWMYLDTVGKVTVGIGHMIPDVPSAQQIAFADTDGASAPAGTIAAAYRAVAAARPALVFTAYRSLTTIRLVPEAQRQLFDTDVGAFVGQLTARFADYDSYPLPARLGILDMGFNLGVAGLTGKFPSFCRSVDARDWPGAAAECNRLGIQQSRNDWTRDQFLAAAGAEPALA